MWTGSAISRSVERRYWRRPPGEEGGPDPPCVLSSLCRVTSLSAADAREKKLSPKPAARWRRGGKARRMTWAANGPWRHSSKIRRLGRRRRHQTGRQLCGYCARAVVVFVDDGRKLETGRETDDWCRSGRVERRRVNEWTSSSIHRFYRADDDDRGVPLYIYYLRSVSSALFRWITVNPTIVLTFVTLLRWRSWLDVSDAISCTLCRISCTRHCHSLS